MGCFSILFVGRHCKNISWSAQAAIPSSGQIVFNGTTCIFFPLHNQELRLAEVLEPHSWVSYETGVIPAAPGNVCDQTWKQTIKIPINYLSYFCILPNHQGFFCCCFFLPNTTQCWDICKRSKRGVFCPPSAQNIFPTTTLVKLVFSVLIWPFWFAQRPGLLTVLAVPTDGAALQNTAAIPSPPSSTQCDSSTLVSISCRFSISELFASHTVFNCQKSVALILNGKHSFVASDHGEALY